MEILTGEALSFLLEFIDETDVIVFCVQMQIKLIKKKSYFTLFS